MGSPGPLVLWLEKARQSVDVVRTLVERRDDDPVEVDLSGHGLTVDVAHDRIGGRQAVRTEHAVPVNATGRAALIDYDYESFTHFFFLIFLGLASRGSWILI